MGKKVEFVHIVDTAANEWYIRTTNIQAVRRIAGGIVVFTNIAAGSLVVTDQDSIQRVLDLVVGVAPAVNNNPGGE